MRALALVIPALACTFSVQSERPLMFGLVFLSILVFTIEVPGSFLGRHPRVVVPATMWLWVNVHGTFSLGFLYLAVYLFGRYLDGSPPHRGRERELLSAPRSRPRSSSSTPTAPASCFSRSR